MNRVNYKDNVKFDLVNLFIPNTNLIIVYKNKENQLKTIWRMWEVVLVVSSFLKGKKGSRTSFKMERDNFSGG